MVNAQYVQDHSENKRDTRCITCVIVINVVRWKCKPAVQDPQRTVN